MQWQTIVVIASVKRFQNLRGSYPFEKKQTIENYWTFKPHSLVE